MEKFQELRDVSRKKIGLADHMLTQTYPLLKDPKLLLASVENLFLAYTNAIGSLLHYERLFKRIPPFQDTFESKFEVFQTECIPRYVIKQEYINTIKEIKEIVVQHRKSPMEFSRNDRFVICGADYQMKTIDYLQLKIMLSQAKEFVDLVNEIVSKNEEIFI